MSIASRITSIEGHISDIYDSVELTGVDTTDIDKNLVNVPNTLKEGYIDIINNGTDTLYNNFPKVSGEGTSLTLNNTYQAPMRNLLKGNTSQTGTPTPTSPIPVNVVSGDNSVVVCGKNLFDVNEFENQLVTGKILNDNGVEVTDVSSTYSKYLIPVKANETFYRKGAWQRMYVYNSKKQLISRGTGVSGFNSAYTPTEDGYIGFQISNSYWGNNKGQEQVNLGNSALSYEPYQGNTYNIDLPVENILDLSTITSTTSSGITVTTNTTTGEISLSGTASGNAFFSFPTRTFNVGDVYSLSVNNPVANSNVGVRYYTTGTQTPTLNLDAINKTEIRTFSASYTGWQIRVASGTTLNNFVLYPQIEKGSKINSFTPYGTTPIELCKIGNYQDGFGKSDGTNLFDGVYFNTYTGGSSPHPYASNASCRSGVIKVKPNTTYTISKEVSNRFRIGEYDTQPVAGSSNAINYIYPQNEGTLTNYTLTTTANTQYLVVQVTNESQENVKMQVQLGSSATPWQPYGVGKWYLHKEIEKIANYNGETITTDYISTTGQLTTGATIYYGLSTPTTTEITDTTLINQLEELYIAKSKENQTNISQINNDLPFIISASALKKG